ncbi:hypothetical protein J1N35_041188, partial [Gossypium stocksii]
KKGGKNWIAIKLDLEKAYDRTSWDFIDATLVAAGIPEFLRKVIVGAISLSSMQILWNGIPFQSFKPVRGIRQGCPLSLYLFVLCMEWLEHIIHSEISAGRWHSIRLSRHKNSARKNNMYFSKGVDDNLCDQISQFFGFQKVLNLERHLGVPLLHDRVTKSTLNFIVEKVR